jgi:hypothetical protein
VLYSVFDAFISHKIYAYETRHAMSLEESKDEHHFNAVRRATRIDMTKKRAQSTLGTHPAYKA